MAPLLCLSRRTRLMGEFRVDNLYLSTWSDLDSDEMRIFLEERFHTGQLLPDGTFAMPLAGESCRISVALRDRKITKITPGPAFDAAEWQQVIDEIERALLTWTPKIGRGFSFSSYRVTGSWTGSRVSIQILPPPESAPNAPVEMAEHPFILEFPLRESSSWRVTNHRWMREHLSLTLLLNVLLSGRTSAQPRRARHLWAYLPHDSGPPQVAWVQEGFFASLGPAVNDQLSPPASESLVEESPDEYYERSGHDGRGLRVPTDLEKSILLYGALSPAARSSFDRATYWVDLAHRQWEISLSASFAFLVSAIESLVPRGDRHRTTCTVCGGECQHEVPGATQASRDFLESHAPGRALRRRRNEMYSLRSGILHGSELMQMDRELFLGFDHIRWKERELQDDLWNLTHFALRNWLSQSSEGQ